MNIVPFDRIRHGPFVYDTFAKSLGDQWPWRMMPRQALVDELKRNIARPGTRTLVAELPEADDAFMGWCCSRPEENMVVFAYTRHAYRRRFGVMTRLLEASGIVTGPTSVRFWTRSSERVYVSKGMRIYWRVTDDREEATCVSAP